MMKGNNLTTKEIWGFGIGALGQNMIFAMVTGFLMLFYTDYIGIGAAVVGTMFLVARIQDAVDDPVQGVLCDRTRSRWGRYRPWILITPFVGSAVLILLFTIPDLPAAGTIVYAYATYILYGLLFSAYDVPYWSMVPTMTDDTHQRTSVIVPARLVCMIGGIVGGAATLPLAKVLGNGNDIRGFQMVAVMFSVVFIVTSLIAFASTRERVAPVKKESEKFSDTVFVISKNGPLLLLLLASLFVTVGAALRGSMAVYYFKYLVGNDVMVSMFSLGGAVFSLLTLFFAPLLSKKWGKKKTFMLGMAITTVIYLASYFVPPSQPMLYIILNVFSGIGQGIFVIVGTSMFADTVEYAEWKIGKRSESMVFSTVTFLAKLAGALGAAAVGFGLSIMGFVPNAAQTDFTLAGINQLMSIWPGVISGLSIVAIYFYTLTEKRYGEIQGELIERRKSRIAAV